MKKFGLIVLTLCLSAFALMAQAPTKLNVKLLNNHFQKVNLTSAYGSSMQTYASADIAEDQFKMIVTLPNDIYKFDFSYRDGTNHNDAYLMNTPGGLFLFAGDKQEVPLVALADETTIDDTEEPVEEEIDELDFSMF